MSAPLRVPDTDPELNSGAPDLAVPTGELLENASDIELAVRLLAAIPLHAGRDRAQLRRWAEAATAFGAALEPETRPTPVRVVESEGGLERGLLARYTSRPPTVELFTDSLGLAERLIDERGWRHWFPPGCVRAAALAHETVHERLHRGPERGSLKRALGHTAARLGPLRVTAHVAGAEELAAHAHARTVCGLGRSPLLLSAALAGAVAVPAREK